MFSRLLPIGLLLVTLAISESASSQSLLTVTRQDRVKVQMNAYQPESHLCLGTAIISPGAGGSESGYEYLAKALSETGWLAIVIGHQESGRGAVRKLVRERGLKAGLSELVTDPSAYEGRFMDIDAARQWAASLCKSPFAVLIGHSMGAATAMLEAGAENKLGLNGKDSFNAYVALSPQGSGSIFPRDAWRRINKPVLTLTGTRDSGLDSQWASRMEPFDNMPPGCKWLGVIDGATHMNFAGRGISGRTENLTTRTILSFLKNAKEGDCGVPPSERGIEIRAK